MENATLKPRPPRKRRAVRWKYGAESDYKLLVFTGERWLPPLYSHDVPHKAIAKGTRAELSAWQKIERLQQLFAKGGTRGNSFLPQAMAFAAIVPNFRKISEAVQLWSPASGWRAVQKREATRAVRSGWRLWLAGNPNKTFTADPESEEFRQYAADLPVLRPDLTARFADPESGELPFDFLLAAFLGETARRLHATRPYQRGYLYHGGASAPALRVDLATGRLCGIGQGGGWISPDFFFMSTPE